MIFVNRDAGSSLDRQCRWGQPRTESRPFSPIMSDTPLIPISSFRDVQGVPVSPSADAEAPPSVSSQTEPLETFGEALGGGGEPKSFLIRVFRHI